jgi:hypothetical protein
MNSAQTGATTSQTGTTETNTYSGTLNLRVPLLPSLRLQGATVDSTNTPMGGVSTNLNSRLVTAGLWQSRDNQSYSVDYSSTWNSGTNELSNARSDFVNAQFTSTLRQDLIAQFREYYSLRVPTNDSSLNPRYEDNTVSAGRPISPTATVMP